MIPQKHVSGDTKQAITFAWPNWNTFKAHNMYTLCQGLLWNLKDYSSGDMQHTAMCVRQQAQNLIQWVLVALRAYMPIWNLANVPIALE